MKAASADALLAAVDEGKVDFAVVSSIDAAIGRNIHLDVDVAFPLGAKREFAWVIGGRHPELGPCALGELLATWVAHDLSHIAQIARVMGRQYTEAVGPWRAYLPMLDATRRRPSR